MVFYQFKVKYVNCHGMQIQTLDWCEAASVRQARRRLILDIKKLGGTNVELKYLGIMNLRAKE